MELQRAFEIFKIDENASLSQIKQRYRHLAKIWHPDRHSENLRSHETALEKMKELNAAYDSIRYYLLSRTHGGMEGEKDSVYEMVTIVSCRSCGTKNRVRGHDDISILRCGKCGAFLFGYADMTAEDEWEERTLCGDDSCTGIIGTDGRCSDCGRSFDEAERVSKQREKLREQALRQYAHKQKVRQNWKKASYISIGIALAIYFAITYSQSLNQTAEQNEVRQAPSTGHSPRAPSPTKETTKIPQATAKGSDEPLYKNSVSYDTYFTAEFFKDSIIGKNNIARLQKNLFILGYKPGLVDGIVGKQTLSAIKQFSDDFEIKPDARFADDLIFLTAYHATIATAHADWCVLCKSGELNMWIGAQPPALREEIEKYLKSGDPLKTIVLLNLYKFDKEKPPPLPMPNNGILRKSFVQGIAPFTLKTKYRDQHHYIKLVDVSKKKAVLTAFVRGGTTLSFDVPLGNYELRAAVGKEWYGERFLFGPNTRYSRANKTFDFKVIGDQVHGYKVEFFLQPHGNLSTSTMSAFDF